MFCNIPCGSLVAGEDMVVLGPEEPDIIPDRLWPVIFLMACPGGFDPPSGEDKIAVSRLRWCLTGE